MLKNFLFMLDNRSSDILSERIDKEPIAEKQWKNLSLSILLLLMTILVSIISLVKYESQLAPVTFAVNMKTKTIEQLNLLPYPQQSFKNVSAWLIDAITTSYSFDFNKFNEQVDSAAYYFTTDGYKTYLTALETSKIKASVIGKKLQISIIPLQNPILINGGSVGSTDFWRFKTPMLISYYGGRDAVTQKTMVEVLVLRVPTYQNYKGLAIAEFNMSPM
jgi:intracellular multiplication protein IcmL